MEKEKQIWKITPVLTGSFGMVRDDIKYRNGKPENQGYVPSVMFLLETCGHLVVVDTGFGDPSVCAEKLQLSVKRSQSLEDIFNEESVKPKEVEAVIFTHLHWDHAGNAECFTNAQYYCHEKEWNRAENHPEEYPEEWFSWLKKNRDRVHLIQGESAQEIIPGIYIQYIGGHTYGSQMVIVNMEEGYGVITGDVVMTEKNLQEEIPVGLCVNGKECETVFEKIRAWKPVMIYPSHDFKIFDRR